VNEARISITPACNYRCFFCHNEGIQVSKDKKPLLNKMRILLNELVENRFTDITFTGGEPFIHADVLLQTIQWLQNTYAKNLPHLTLVTNGSLVKPEHLKALTHYPYLKVHVSMHTTDAEKYHKITQQKRHKLSRALEVIKGLSAYKIHFKINYVLLKGINTDKRDIWNIIELAEQYGAQAVKFLELLVMEENEHLYPYYYNIQSAEAIVKKNAQLKSVTDRRKTYRPPGRHVNIELQRCTCKIGCRKCLKNRDQTFTAGLQYYPCMEASDQSYPVKPGEMKAILKRGRAFIGKLAAQYGDRSPSLLQDTRYIRGRREIFFLADETTVERLTQFARKLERQHFEEWFYEPRTADEIWRSKNRLIKIRRHFTNERLAKIYGATVFLEEKDGLRFQRTVYFDAKHEIFSGAPEVAKRFLEALDMVCILHTEVNLYNYQWEGVKYSVGYVKDGPTIIGIDLDSFADNKQARNWIASKNLQTKGERLFDLLGKMSKM